MCDGLKIIFVTLIQKKKLDLIMLIDEFRASVLLNDECKTVLTKHTFRST